MKIALSLRICSHELISCPAMWQFRAMGCPHGQHVLLIKRSSLELLRPVSSSKEGSGFDPSSGLPTWTLHVLPTPAWVYSNMHISLIRERERSRCAFLRADKTKWRAICKTLIVSVSSAVTNYSYRWRKGIFQNAF